MKKAERSEDRSAFFMPATDLLQFPAAYFASPFTTSLSAFTRADSGLPAAS